MKISRSRLLLVAAFAAAVLSAGAMPLPTGYDQMDVGNYTNAVTVYTYKPRSYSNGPLLIVMHGMLRDAELYCSHAVPLADRYHLLVAAPYFDTNRFPPAAYNLGGVVRHQTLQPRESWTYQWILETVKAIREREGNPALPYYLIGHSAGAQFVMRYAAFMPPGAERIVAANPGSDLFPRTDWKFGYGFGGLPSELGDEAALQRYLAAPLTLYLGRDDTDPQHPELDRTPAAELEGRYRLERGRACFEFAKKLADARGWQFNWRKVEVRGIAHDARAMFAADAAGKALFPEGLPGTAKP